MVKHVIIWKLKNDLENPAAQTGAIKNELEALVGKIDGLLEMKIHTNPFPCSAGDIMMDSVFVSKQALDDYQKHPLHQAIAKNVVRPAVEQRLSFDYEI